MSTRAISLVWFWLGAATLFIAVVAPAAFAVLPTRAMAGLLVGRVLPVLFYSGAGIGLLLFLNTQDWRRGAAVALTVASLGAQIGVAPRIHRSRQALGPELEAIPVTDPRRVAFGRLHGISVALLGVGMLAATAIALGGLSNDRLRRANGHKEPMLSAVPHSPSGV